MKRKINIIGLTLFFTLTLSSLAFSEESMTITTYYPSPYGSYNELTTAGNTYLATDSGNVGIGTTGPDRKLTVLSDNGLDVKSSTGYYVNLNYLYGTSIASLYALDSGGALTNLALNPGGGNVGIGTASPTAKLHVNGNIKAVLNDIDGGSPANMRYNSGTNEIGYDVAELFETNEEVESGDVLCIDRDGKLKKNTVAYDTKVAGVVSESPAILFEGSQLQIAPQPFEFKGGNKPPVALAGRVKCKVIVQETGPIKIGDLLVTSSKPGFATKADIERVHIGTVLGKALESLNEGEGKILILATLQ